jgi:hypothetical protein
MPGDFPIRDPRAPADSSTHRVCRPSLAAAVEVHAMPEVTAFLLLLWSFIGIDVELHPVDGPVHFTDLYGEERHAPGALACPTDGPPQLWLSGDAAPSIVVHELAHALDCSDDGSLNGSLGQRPHSRPDWVSDYCWSSDAEWYACSVTRAEPFAPGSASLAAAPPSPTRPLPVAGAAPATRPPERCASRPAWSPTPDLIDIGTGSLLALIEPSCEA